MISPARVCVALIAVLSQVASERAVGPKVDFVALRSDGTPVSDLLPSEVEIRVGDRARSIKSLHLIGAGPVPASAKQAARAAAPYGTNDDVAVGRRFIIVVDQESFIAGRQQLVRNAVEGLLGQLTPADLVMVAALPFGGIKAPFTSDTARIRRAMDGMSAQGSSRETGSELACRTRRFLESLDGFLMAQPGGASPSTLILFTSGLAAPRRDAPMALAPGMCELVIDQFRRMTAVASAARANVYIVVPADVGVSGVAPRESISGVGFLGSDNPLEGIEHLAGATGAARLSLDGVGNGTLLRVARETSSFYEAELEPERGEVFGRSRPFSVRALRRDVTVRARPEITLADPARRAGGVRLAVADLLGSLEAVPDLRLRIGGFTVREPGGGLRLGVLVETADPAAALESAGAILIAGDGRVVGRWFAKDAAEHPLIGAIAAPPGPYTLRVAALDVRGRPGVAEAALDVGLTEIGPLTLGGLMLGVSRPEGMKPQLEFSSQPTAIASFDIYGGTSGLPLSATLEVAREPDGPALAVLPLTLNRADESRVVATGAVPLGALPPGDYVIRGVIRLEGGATGRVMRTLRKVTR